MYKFSFTFCGQTTKTTKFRIIIYQI